MTDSHGGGGSSGGSERGTNDGGTIGGGRELTAGTLDARGPDVYSQPVRATSLSALLNPEAAAAAAHGLEIGTIGIGASSYAGPGPGPGPLPSHYSLQATGEGPANKGAKQFEATVGRAVAPMAGEGPMPQRAERFRNPAGTAHGMPPLAPGYGSPTTGYETSPGTTALGYASTLPVGGAYGPGTGGGGTILPHYGSGVGHAHLAPSPANTAYTGATYGMSSGGGMKRTTAAYPSYSPIISAGGVTGNGNNVPSGAGTGLGSGASAPHLYQQHHHHQQSQMPHPLMTSVTQHHISPPPPILPSSSSMRPVMPAGPVGIHHQPSPHTLYPSSQHHHHPHPSMVMPTHSSYYAYHHQHQHQPPSIMMHPMMAMSSPRPHPLGAAAPAYGFGSSGRGASLRPLEVDDDTSSGTGSKPYARSPRLKHTHKLAERKRRSELRSMFEQLEALLPGRERSLSKSEVVQKTIETIDQLVEKRDKLLKEREALRAELGESAPPTTGEIAQAR